MKSAEAFLLILLLFLLGCRREDLRVYDAPKEYVAVAAQLPEGWKQLPPDEMSVTKFIVRGNDGGTANIAFSVFAPSDELANVNRWRKQVGLEPIAADELARQRETIDITGHSASMFEMSGVAADGEKKTRLVAAMLNHGDTMWFFKMTGDDDLVAAQKPAFVQFLSGYSIPGDAHGPVASTRKDAPAPAPPAPAPAARKWNAPASWTEQPPGPMQEAKFSAANGKAIVSISIFPGATGGMRANINRWRNQLGLAPVTDAELEKVQTPLDLPDAKATIVDLAGQNSRMVTVIVPRGTDTWFFKMLGEPAVVESEKNLFLEFVKATK